MLSLQVPSLRGNLLSSSPSLLVTGKSRVNPETNQHGSEIVTFKTRRARRGLRSSSVTARAAEKSESQSQQQYEIDQDKAREALSKLDQQLESLSKKPIPSPKIRASDVKLSRDRTATEEDATELSGSFLAYLTVALLVFTIFYNVLFYTVIKPSIDGPEYTPEIPLVSSEALASSITSSSLPAEDFNGGS
ncbi:hypothetical protein CDL15_Pgr026603 [Punica granatum]|uniref:Uncharacterized protein n=1 Tax=Punica granatum TaxID=22663 RepID=A0A218WKZ9_PUNGR|nr:hypothetical protein CDL15_Pgr026603 [Punica granatum]